MISFVIRNLIIKKEHDNNKRTAKAVKVRLLNNSDFYNVKEGNK